MKSIIEIMAKLRTLTEAAISRINHGEIVDHVNYNVWCSLDEKLVPTGGAITAYCVIKGTNREAHVWTVYCHKRFIELPCFGDIVDHMNAYMDIVYDEYCDWVSDEHDR